LPKGRERRGNCKTTEKKKSDPLEDGDGQGLLKGEETRYSPGGQLTWSDPREGNERGQPCLDYIRQNGGLVKGKRGESSGYYRGRGKHYEPTIKIKNTPGKGKSTVFRPKGDHQGGRKKNEIHGGKWERTSSRSYKESLFWWPKVKSIPQRHPEGNCATICAQGERTSFLALSEGL